ncbi:UDP-N-acetylmuramate dehydrogenase [Patulibacter minatonensis]|uniref:UDP-N-acetylmuramate dehydrogenase n=1 Tax=Patulibacter minatonensis TaxID=298163 RepID=UPI001FDFF6D4|nr:UDP-N-acetylmuramate dehydrogenase [Patulibacter minatonensis]
MPDAVLPVPGLPVARSGAAVPLGPLTTLGVGGTADRLVVAEDEEALVAAVTDADATGRPVLLLAGGSNLVIGDGPVAGDVVVIRTTGTADVEGPAPSGDAPTVLRTVAAGEPWDAVVARSVADGLAGLECLSGIPGAAGATPIQNVGAYGQEVADTVVAVRALDRRTGRVVRLTAEELGFAYRDSVLKGRADHVVLDVTFALERSALGRPVRYGELARAVGAEDGRRVPSAELRDAVLALRRGKGMVLDPGDPDTRSAGSFFTNPILDDDAFARLRTLVARRLGDGVEPPAFPADPGRTKTSAAWLIERAGFARGHARPGAAISSKHTLALTSRGGGAADLLALAHEVADGVRDAFGVALHPEPVLVGVGW